MHLLYIDESGDPHDPNLEWFVLAGYSIFERHTWHLAQELGRIAAEIEERVGQRVELHASELRSRRNFPEYSREERDDLLLRSLQVVSDCHSVRVFVVAIQKGSLDLEDPLEYAIEQMAHRFDNSLRRFFLTRSDRQRGVIIFDNKPGQKDIQNRLDLYRTEGHAYGTLRNLAEVPFFLDSKASRLMQAADLVAYAAFRHYQSSDSRFWDVIKQRVDAADGVEHGLHVRRRPS